VGVNLHLSGDDEHYTDLCTDGGYSALCEWIDSLPADRFPAVHELANAGTYKPTDRLARELNGAFYEFPPDDPDVHHTADRLCDLLGVGRPNERVTIES
jgi:hypothetical protein